MDFPIVEGPITGASFLMGTSWDQALQAASYESKEYFISGTATSYRSINSMPSNGIWKVEPAGSAAYKTRILVYKPVNAAQFNGTVVVEWFNVSAGGDSAPDWNFMHNELLRHGYAWIGVSAQSAGVEGTAAMAQNWGKMDLKTVDSERYGSLCHPGDDYCYDIYSQVAKIIRNPRSINLLAGCHVERILATGDSQSAAQLTSYVNAIQPRDKLYDGFLLHSRGINAFFGSDSSGNLQKIATAVSTQDYSDVDPVFIRTDINVPVLMLESETDVILFGYYKARQADTDKVRLWEMAGTAHADLYMVTGINDNGNDLSFANVVEVKNLGFFELDLPMNAGPQHFITKAAIRQLDKWVRTGIAPTTAARLEIAGDPPELVLDKLGNAKGGVRTPYVDVPIAKLSGLGQPDLHFIPFGTTKLFDKATLSKLYPDHRTYVTIVRGSTDVTVKAGFLLPEDGELIKKAAEASDIGNP